MLRTIIAALTALAVAGPAAIAQGRLQVTATSADLKALVEAVGGERVDVDSLAAPEQDPHTVEVKPAQLARLRSAALLVKVGLDHEPWLARLSLRQMRVLDLSREVRLLQTTTPRLRAERHVHTHAHGNTHYWLDPRNAGPMTAAIAAALRELSPADKAAFEQQRAAFLARLEPRIAAWERELQPFRGTRIVVMHDSWAYLAEWLGLQVVAAAEPHPGIAPSPAELATLLQRMREAKVPLLIAEPSANPALVRQIADRGGAKAVVLQASGFDYIQLLEDNVRKLGAALGRN